VVLLERKPGLARRFRERAHPAVIAIAAAIEHDGVDAFWGMTVIFPFGLILLNIFLGVGLINISGVVIAMYENNYWYLLISSPIFIIFGILWPFWAVALSGV